MDSFKIAALMRGGNFPLAYVYPRNMRATRDLLRRRTNLVRHGADLKAHVANTTSQYNLPPNKVNLKNVGAREQLNTTFHDPVVQRNINLDMAVLECYHRELSQVEWFLEKQAKKHQPAYFYLLKTIPGIGVSNNAKCPVITKLNCPLAESGLSLVGNHTIEGRDHAQTRGLLHDKATS